MQEKEQWGYASNLVNYLANFVKSSIAVNEFDYFAIIDCIVILLEAYAVSFIVYVAMPFKTVYLNFSQLTHIQNLFDHFFFTNYLKSFKQHQSYFAKASKHAFSATTVH